MCRFTPRQGSNHRTWRRTRWTKLKGGYSVVILDTAGRSQLDGALMDELHRHHQKVHPVETLLVVDSMIGQEAVNIAKGFRDAIPLTGLVLTKMDGDARGGAAISIRAVTGVPIKFLGTGEASGCDSRVFDPGRLASRILGMGDILGLIEKAEAAFDQQTAQKEAEKLMTGDFTLEDFANQLRQVRKMGPIGQILEMLPGGMGQMARQISTTGCRAAAQADRSDHQLDDPAGTAQPGCAERQPPPANCARLGHRCPGCEPADQAVPRNTEDVQNDQEIWRAGYPRLFG